MRKYYTEHNEQQSPHLYRLKTVTPGEYPDLIIDRLENSEKYINSHKGFAESFAFLKKAFSEDLPVGRYEIDGDNVFAFIQEYTSKTESAFETHKNYIDIQFVHSGVEVI